MCKKFLEATIIIELCLGYLRADLYHGRVNLYIIIEERHKLSVNRELVAFSLLKLPNAIYNTNFLYTAN